jgi:hypothetical protein
MIKTYYISWFNLVSANQPTKQTDSASYIRKDSVRWTTLLSADLAQPADLSFCHVIQSFDPSSLSTELLYSTGQLSQQLCELIQPSLKSGSCRIGKESVDPTSYISWSSLQCEPTCSVASADLACSVNWSSLQCQLIQPAVSSDLACSGS